MLAESSKRAADLCKAPSFSYLSYGLLGQVSIEFLTLLPSALVEKSSSPIRADLFSLMTTIRRLETEVMVDSPASPKQSWLPGEPETVDHCHLREWINIMPMANSGLSWKRKFFSPMAVKWEIVIVPNKAYENVSFTLSITTNEGSERFYNLPIKAHTMMIRSDSCIHIKVVDKSEQFARFKPILRYRITAFGFPMNIDPKLHLKYRLTQTLGWNLGFAAQDTHVESTELKKIAELCASLEDAEGKFLIS